MDHRIEERIKKLEDSAEDARDRLARIETRLDQMPTKADMQASMNAMIKWMVGTAVGLGVAAITVITFTLNNAIPKHEATPHSHYCDHHPAPSTDGSKA